MPRLPITAAALIISAVAAAADTTLVDSLPALCDNFVYTLRIKARPTTALPASISFGGDPTVISLRIPSLADAADAIPVPIQITATDSLGRIIARTTAHTTIPPLDRGFTIRLSANAAGLSAAIGGPHEESRIDIPSFHTQHAAAITATIPDGTTIMRRTLRSRPLDPHSFAPFPTLDSLLTYLAASTDPREGLYTYLDKDIPLGSAAAISRPEAYKFAITRHPNIPGTYLIIHLQSAHTGWQPLEIKATLTPTPFINHYNLRWTDANRRPQTTDTYAQYNENASILTLSFPLLPATIRLSRQK